MAQEMHSGFLKEVRPAFVIMLVTAVWSLASAVLTCKFYATMLHDAATIWYAQSPASDDKMMVVTFAISTVFSAFIALKLAGDIWTIRKAFLILTPRQMSAAT